jgi:hypothetical protein
MQQVQSNRAEYPDDLVASGLMVEMRFKPGRKTLSLRAGKLLHLLTKAAGAVLCEPIVHSIALRDIREIAMLSKTEIKEIAEELTDTKIEIHSYYPKETWSLGAILSGVKLHVTDSALTYRFSDAMIELFSMDDRWTIISKRLMLEFESRYALRLFEMLSLRKNMRKNTEEFEVDDLRSRLGIETDKLKLFGHFKAYALNPAVEEINRITEMQISYDLIKKSRAVRAVKLQWSIRATIESRSRIEHESASPVDQATAPEATAGLAPKAVEAHVAFPSEGSIRNLHPWHGIAEIHCPGYDFNLAASGFRSLASRKQGGFALKGPGLEARFVSYCQTKAFATASARARQAALGNRGF